MTPEGLPAFRDRSADLERYGFGTAHTHHDHLPGDSWEAGNMFRSLILPNCNVEDAVFDDPVWQFGRPERLRLGEKAEDQVLYDIFYSDAIRRLQAVEQLTLPPEYTTIPNTGAFSRFEHIWGSVLFVRQIAAQNGITGREAMRLQLRTLVSDVAHTFGSHLGDWMFQGVGGAENQHDVELKSYLEATGINDILRRYNFRPDEVIFPDINDWVEADQPDLCVDRVDYGLREMNRWNQAIHSSAFKADDFTLTPEGMLAMRDQRRARLFSEGFLLLSQEHWSEPTHRFMIDMLMLRAKLFYGEGRAPRSWLFDDAGLVDLQKIHPRDLMYVTEPAQLAAYALPNLNDHILDAMMKSVAQYRRQYVWPGRQERIFRYMEQFYNPESYGQVTASGTYNSLESSAFDSYMDEYPRAQPNGFAILEPDVAERTGNDYSIDIGQPPFKIRQIDPLVETEAGFSRLSELDPTYAERLDEHRHTLQQSKVARLMIPDPTTLALVKQMRDNVEAHWQHRLQTSRRLTGLELGRLVTISSREVFGKYPFLNFLQY